MLFTDLKIQSFFLRYSRSKSETTTGSLWEAQTKTAKKDYFTKNLSSPMFFEINISNLKEVFHDIYLKSSVGRSFQKNKKKKVLLL